MADQNTNNPDKNRDKAEGDRETVQQNLAAGRGEDNPAARYDDTSAEGGGITNRPLDEEVENQDALPQRGQTKQEDRQREDER